MSGCVISPTIATGRREPIYASRRPRVDTMLPAPSGPRDRPERSGRKVRTPLRAACRVTPGRGDAKESATENRPPFGSFEGRTVRVKRCGKSAPPRRQRRGHGKPHAEQGQIGRWRAPVPPASCGTSPGRLLEPEGDLGPRGMIATPAAGQPRSGTEFGLSARSGPLSR
jgi:hypothetical protein